NLSQSPRDLSKGSSARHPRTYDFGGRALADEYRPGAEVRGDGFGGVAGSPEFCPPTADKTRRSTAGGGRSPTTAASSASASPHRRTLLHLRLQTLPAEGTHATAEGR